MTENIIRTAVGKAFPEFWKLERGRLWLAYQSTIETLQTRAPNAFGVVLVLLSQLSKSGALGISRLRYVGTTN